MKKIENFDQINEAGEFKSLPKGIYGIVFTDVADNPEKEYLEISWDIVKGEYANYIKTLVEAGLKDNYKIIRSYKQSALRFFKSFIVAIEKSNSNFTWNWDEKSIINKKAIGVVGEEEYIDKEGNVKVVTKLVEVRSIQSFKEGKVKVPEIKKVTEADWEAWRSKNGVSVSEEAKELDIADDDLPF